MAGKKRILFAATEGKVGVRVALPTKRELSDGVKLLHTTNGFQWYSLELTPAFLRLLKKAMKTPGLTALVKEHSDGAV